MATTEFSKFAGILSAAFKSSSFFLEFLFIYSFSAVLSLCCCAWAFSSFSEWGLLFDVVHEPLIVVASLAEEHRL